MRTKHRHRTIRFGTAKKELPQQHSGSHHSSSTGSDIFVHQGHNDLSMSLNRTHQKPLNWGILTVSTLENMIVPLQDSRARVSKLNTYPRPHNGQSDKQVPPLRRTPPVEGTQRKKRLEDGDLINQSRAKRRRRENRKEQPPSASQERRDCGETHHSAHLMLAIVVNWHPEKTRRTGHHGSMGAIRHRLALVSNTE